MSKGKRNKKSKERRSSTSSDEGQKKKRCTVTDATQSQLNEFENDSLDGTELDATLPNIAGREKSPESKEKRRNISQSRRTSRSAQSTSDAEMTSLRLEESGRANVHENQRHGKDTVVIQNQEHNSEKTRNVFSQPTLGRSDENNQIKQVLMVSTIDNVRLSNLNPIKIARGMDEICPDKVEGIQRHSSGGIVITVKNKIQAEKLLKTTSLYMNMYPVKTTSYANVEMCYAKIYAPEFMADDLESLKIMLEEVGVKSIRKLYKDPQKAKIPLYF